MNLDEELSKEEAWDEGYNYAMHLVRDRVGLRVPDENDPDFDPNPYRVPPWALMSGHLTRKTLELQDAINEAVRRREGVGL